MQTMPTRITIELEPSDERRGGWRARTSVDGRRVGREAIPAVSVVAADSPDVAWTPTPYEPCPCTCEDGLCDRDHETD